MDLSIIIVSWNTRDLLLNCLESIYQEIRTFPQLKIETWVVDNASTDDSVVQVREKYSAVKLILNQENVGFAGGNNQAIRQSSGRYVLLLNPDTVIKPNGLKALVEFMDSNPQAGAAGSLLLNPDGTLQTSCYPALTLSRELWRLFHLDAVRLYGVYRMSDWDTNKAREIDVLKGASLILRKTALEQVGLLDDTYFMYTEDADWCWRARQHGFLIYYEPAARIWHKISASSGGKAIVGGMTGFKVFYKIRGMLKFFGRYAKWYHWFTIPFFWLLQFLQALVMLIAAKNWAGIRAMLRILTGVRKHQ